jgi:hypothetical protein
MIIEKQLSHVNNKMPTVNKKQVEVPALAKEALRKPYRTPLGSYHYNQTSFEESGHRVQGRQQKAEECEDLGPQNREVHLRPSPYHR